MQDDFDQQDIDEWTARLRSHPSYKRDWTAFPDGADQHQIKNSRTVSSYDEAMAFLRQDNPMQEYRIPRSGDRPLAFRGEVLKSVESPENNSHDVARSRRFAMAIYRTDSGKYVAEFRYMSKFPHEKEVVDAEVFDRPDADAITDWYNEAAGMGPDGPGIIRGPFPGTSNWEQRTREIKLACGLEFDRCLGIVLDLPMFEERV